MATGHGIESSLLGQPARYRTGLEDLGAGLWAWLQPNGGLGESNAGLVVGRGESLLVDTLWDLRLTRRMLAAISPHIASAPIGRLVNTHADGDHCWGNQLIAGATISATESAALDMLREEPKRLRLFSRIGAALGKRSAHGGLVGGALGMLPPARWLAGLGAFARMLAAYDFEGVTLTPPTEIFTGALEVEVGGRRVEPIEVGSAHSPGDLIVHVPDERVVFAGDLVFVGVTPIMWVVRSRTGSPAFRIIAWEPRL